MAAASAPRVTVLLLFAAFAGCGAFLTDLIVMEGSKTSCQEGYQLVNGSTLNGNFNQGADDSDAHYIILCARFQGLGANSTPGITGLTVVANKDKAFSGCGTLDASLWTRIRQDGSSNGDFNHGAGGSFIFLCYSTSPSFGSPIASLSLTTTNACDAGSSRIPAAGDSNGDFNQHAGGKDIFMCAAPACLATEVVGLWTAAGVVPSGQTTVQVTHGSSTQLTESQTKDFSSSVTRTVAKGGFKVKAGIDYKGAASSILSGNVMGSASVVAGGQFMVGSVSSTVGQSFSQSFSSEFSTFQQTTVSIGVDREDKGKTWWQFAFVTTDSCNPSTPTTTLTQEVAFTPGQYQQPCCVPGFATDAPYYTTCVSPDYQVPGVHCPTTTSTTTTSTSTSTTTSTTRRHLFKQSFLESRGGHALEPGEDVSAFLQYGAELTTHAGHEASEL